MHPFQVIMLLCAVFMLHAADIEKPEVQLSFNAQRALDGYTRDTEKLQDSFDKDKAKLTDTVVKALQRELDATAKKGDLTGALAIKAKIDELNPGLVFVESKPKVLRKSELAGLYTFDFNNGHKGILEVKNKSATHLSSGITGTVAVTPDGYRINWSNNTQWGVSYMGAELTASAPDGESKLTKSVE